MIDWKISGHHWKQNERETAMSPTAGVWIVVVVVVGKKTPHNHLAAF